MRAYNTDRNYANDWLMSEEGMATDSKEIEVLRDM